MASKMNRFSLLAAQDAKPLQQLDTDHVPNNPMNKFTFDTSEWERVGKNNNKAPGNKPFINPGLENRRPFKHAKELPVLRLVNVPPAKGRPRPPKSDNDRAHVGRPTEQTKGPASNSIEGSPPRSALKNYCGPCHMQFATKTAIVSHVKEHNHEHYCNLCTRVFVDRNGLKNHVENSPGHEHVCNLCLSAFLDANGLSNHLLNTSNHPHACRICLVGFKTVHEFNKHRQTADKHVWCRTCHRRFPNQEQRDEHWKTSNKHKHCLMPGCEFDAPNMRLLNKHLRENHFMCSNCEELFPSHSKLNAHQQVCIESEERNTIAPLPPALINIPMESKPTAAVPAAAATTQAPKEPQIRVPGTYSCWLCDRPMPHASGLIKHLESGNCKKFPDPAVLMTFLGRWWYSVLYMDIGIHVQIRTGRVDIKEVINWAKEGIFFPFVCRGEGCNKVFGSLSALAAHIEGEECPWEIEKLGLKMLTRDLQTKMALGEGVGLPF